MFTITNNRQYPVDFTDAYGQVVNVQGSSSVTTPLVTASLYSAVAAGDLAIGSWDNTSSAAMAAAHNFRKSRMATQANPLAVTCTAGAAIATAAQVAMGYESFYLSAAGPVTVGTATTTPILPDGAVDGQEIRLINVGANSITLTDQDTMAASNLHLTGATVVLAAKQSITLKFVSSLGDWIQTTTLCAVA